jgi:hypothetical protein
MTEIRYNGHSQQTAQIRVTAGAVKAEKTVSIGEIERVGDADVSDTLARAMETGQWETVPSKTNARGVAPKNYAVRF